MIKVLHTADWHLGKRLEQYERTEEQQYFLDWLRQTIAGQQVDVLVVAGDIFDTGAPPNTALRQYYEFLGKLRGTSCRTVVIIGGNHDSVSTLNAPKDLLRFFDVHVVGGVPEDFNEQVIPIRNGKGEVELVVCAVPFLRDKDVRLSIAGESLSDLESRLRAGIIYHYQRLVAPIQPYKKQGIPVLATGHLFAQGASSTESEKDIHVGNLGQIGADGFPPEFDYVALGHLHRPQKVNGVAHIRYSGSPIPLSFSEAGDTKQVVLLQFEGSQPVITEIPVPPVRQLLRVEGRLEEVKTQLKAIADPGLPLPVWVEVQLLTPGYLAQVEEDLREWVRAQPWIEKLFIRQRRERQIELLSTEVETETLFDLTPQAVFRKRLEKEGTGGDESLTQLFNAAVELMHQRESAAELNNKE